MSNTDKCQATSWTADMLATHMREDHGWSIFATEYDDIDSLKAMHRVAVEQAPAVRTWWLALEPTHGELHLACVSEPWDTSGLGGMEPDGELVCTAAQLATTLRAGGYELETDDAELLAAWRAR